MKVNNKITAHRRSAAMQAPPTPTPHGSADAAQVPSPQTPDAHLPPLAQDALTSLLKPATGASVLGARFAQHNPFFRTPHNDDERTREKISGTGGEHILLRKDPVAFADRARELLGAQMDLSTAPQVLLHGDAHVEQYVQSGGRFGLSDMDHARPGVWAEDVVRLWSSVRMKTADFPAGTEAMLLGTLREAYLNGVDNGHDDAPPSAFVKDDPRVSTRAYLDDNGYMASLMRQNPIATDDPQLAQLVEAYAQSRDDLTAASGGFFKIVEAGMTADSGVASRGEERFLVVIDGQSAGKQDDIFLEFKAQTRDGADTIAANKMYNTPEAHQGHCEADGTSYWVHELDATYQELETLETPAHAERALAAIGRQLGAAHGASTDDKNALKAHFSSFLDECSVIGQMLTDELCSAQKAYAQHVAAA